MDNRFIIVYQILEFGNMTTLCLSRVEIVDVFQKYY